MSKEDGGPSMSGPKFTGSMATKALSAFREFEGKGKEGVA